MTEQCSYCSSHNIIRAVKVQDSSGETSIGLRYEHKGSLLVQQRTEPLLTDICSDCGSVLRFFVQQTGLKFVVSRTKK